MMSFQPRRDVIPQLDGLRALAVLLVLWEHLPDNLLGRPLKLAALALQPGYFGVDLFFVLSGFLITRILLFNRENGVSLKDFMIRRMARIFPVYYALLAILSVFAFGPYLIWCATYLSNFAFSFDRSPNPMRHTWSLCVEEHFYLVWPFVAVKLGAAKVARIAIWMIAAAYVLAVLAVLFRHWHQIDMLVYRATPFRLGSLGIGAFAAVHENFLRSDLKRLKWIAFGFLGTAILFAAPGLATSQIEEFRAWTKVFKLIGFGFASGFLLLIVLSLSDAKTFLAKSLSSGVLPYIGRISYGLYLFHYPIFYFMNVLDGSQTHDQLLLRTLIAVLASFAAASISFHFFEKPFMDWQRRKLEPKAA